MGLMGRTTCEVGGQRGEYTSEESENEKASKMRERERESTHALSSIGESLLMSLLTLTVDCIGFLDGKSI